MNYNKIISAAKEASDVDTEPGVGVVEILPTSVTQQHDPPPVGISFYDDTFAPNSPADQDSAYEDLGLQRPTTRYRDPEMFPRNRQPAKTIDLVRSLLRNVARRTHGVDGVSQGGVDGGRHLYWVVG